MNRSKGISQFASWLQFLLSVFLISSLCGACYGQACFRHADVVDTGPVVVTKTGIVVGKYVNVFGGELPTFLGIPYAMPPIGERRFKIAEPIEFWNGTIFAKEKSAECMQYYIGDVGKEEHSAFRHSEDCLYLNIWLPPNCCCDRFYKLPVMVYINGDGYYSESETLEEFNGDILATFGEVIVVSLNYRVGVFGFLNVDSIDAPGNMGLYDQHLALRWIQENIIFFGGDPSRVTLFGENEGSLSVSLQMISPFSRNLFHKAILVSGTALQPYKVYDINEARVRAGLFSELVGCANHKAVGKYSRKDILICLMSKPADELALADNYFSRKYHFFSASYGNECENCLKFFIDSPAVSALSGDFYQIPTLIGYNEEAGGIFMQHTIPSIFRWDYKEQLTIPVAKQLLYQFFTQIKGIEFSPDKLYDYYVKKGSFDDPVYVINSIYNDYFMNCGIMYFADNIKDVYIYFHSHQSYVDSFDEQIGLNHLFEVPYVFGDPIRNAVKYSVDDIHFSADIIRKWTSFAYDGYPLFEAFEPEWPKYTTDDRFVLELHSGGNRVVKFASERTCDEFWRPYFEL